MNIFILDESPDIAAHMLCDKHIPKMLLESAQLLSTLARHHLGDEVCNTHGLYKSTHQKHPCQLWLREHIANVSWLWSHMCYMNQEYQFRFKHHNIDHKSMKPAIEAVIMLKHHAGIKFGMPLLHDGYTPFVQCMPSAYQIPGNPVAAYRAYYAAEKSYFAKWERGTPQPQWFTDLCSAPNVTPVVSNQPV